MTKSTKTKRARTPSKTAEAAVYTVAYVATTGDGKRTERETGFLPLSRAKPFATEAARWPNVSDVVLKEWRCAKETAVG